MNTAAHRRIGLVAGWGRYPIVVAEALRRQGYGVYCLGVKDHADEARLRGICDHYRTIGLARLGAAVRYFRRHKVREVTMAGKIHKVLLFRRFAWLKHLPDWQAVRTFWPHWVSRTAARNDDSLLTAVCSLAASNGLHVAPATDFAPELLVKHGPLTSRGPSFAQKKDIEFGWKLAKEMGRLDVGQSVAVKDQAVLAVEAIEGTDACIRRAGQLCTAGGFTLVKTAKPRQDMRFDVPTIGLGTLETLHGAGGSVLAIEAGRTIIVDEQAVIDFANRHKITVVALHNDETSAEARQG